MASVLSLCEFCGLCSAALRIPSLMFCRFADFAAHVLSFCGFCGLCSVALRILRLMLCRFTDFARNFFARASSVLPSQILLRKHL